MHVIQTRYAGCHFRSRTEARWAVFFDRLRVRWEYEKEGFELDDGTCYLPDFWLPDLQVWFEVKGRDVDVSEGLAKGELLFRGTTFPVVMVYGRPGSHEMRVRCSNGREDVWIDECNWSDPPEGLRITTNGPRLSGARREGEYLTAALLPTISITSDAWVWSVRVMEALDAARSARFEYGQVGAT